MHTRLAAAILATALLTGCTAAPSPSATASPSSTLPTATTPTVALPTIAGTTYIASNHVQRERIYTTLDDLLPYADAIFIGEVTGTRTTVGEDGGMWTATELRVTEALKGELSPGRAVRLAEMGGAAPYLEYYRSSLAKEPKDFDQPTATPMPGIDDVRIGYDGVFPLAVGDVALIFARTTQAEGAQYEAVGDGDGRFIKTGDTYARTAADYADEAYLALTFTDRAIKSQLKPRVAPAD